MRHQSFLDISQAPDLKSFEERLLGFAHEMEFVRVQAIVVEERTGQPSKVVSVGNTPHEFMESFQHTENAKRDPLLQMLKRVNVPIIYDQSSYVDAKAGDLWEEQAPWGYKTGVAVALHLARHRHVLVGMDRDDPLPTDDVELTRLMATVQLLAVHAQDAAIRFLSADLGDEVVRLTGREIECLRWTMEGKTAWEVGTILGIGERTVVMHTSNAMHKLDCTNKHQAVLKAVRQGLI